MLIKPTLSSFLTAPFPSSGSPSANPPTQRWRTDLRPPPARPHRAENEYEQAREKALGVALTGLRKGGRMKEGMKKKWRRDSESAVATSSSSFLSSSSSSPGLQRSGSGKREPRSKRCLSAASPPPAPPGSGAAARACALAHRSALSPPAALAASHFRRAQDAQAAPSHLLPLFPSPSPASLLPTTPPAKERIDCTGRRRWPEYLGSLRKMVGRPQKPGHII